MKTFFCQLALLLGLGLLTQTASAQTAADEQSIRAFLNKGLQDHYAGNVEGLTALFAEQAVLIDFTGVKVVGRPAIREFLTAAFKENIPAPGSIQYDVQSIRFIDANHVVMVSDLSGSAQMGDQTIHWKAVDTMVLTRNGNSWLIELEQTTPLMPPPGAEGN